MPAPEENPLLAEEQARVEAERTQERVALLLTEAFSLSEQNKVEQAKVLAEEASRLLPTSTTALSLLASLYERGEDREKAIAAMERVVQLNPESAADREKLELIRRGVRVLPKHEPASGGAAKADKPDASEGKREPLPLWFSLSAAGVVGVVVFAVGLTAFRPRPPKPAPLPPVVAATPAAPLPSAPVNLVAPTKPYVPPAADVRPDPFASFGGSDGTARAAAPQSASPAPPRRRRTAPTGGKGPSPLPPLGVKPSGPVVIPVRPPQSPPATTAPPASSTAPQPRFAPSGGGFGNGGRVAVAPPPSPASPSSPAAPSPSAAPPPGSTPTSNGGYIRIQVGRPKGDGDGAIVRPPAPPAEPADPLLRAQRHQSAGRYRDAIAAYKEATAISTGEAYQGIGLCYQRLGEMENAIGAYRQALSAYEQRVTSGRGAESAKRGIATCRAALEVIGG